jgi:hypothetical protein
VLQMAGTETKGYLPYILHNVCILTFVMIFLLYFNFDVLTSCFIWSTRDPHPDAAGGDFACDFPIG